MQLPEFKGLQNFGASSFKLGNQIASVQKNKIDEASSAKAERRADRADRANAKALGEEVEVEGEYDNPAPKRRRNGSEITPFPKFDSFDDDYSEPTSRGGATSYDEETGELMMDLESPWTTRDTGRAVKEVSKLAGRAAKKVGAKIYQKGKERFSKGGGNSSQFDTPDFDDPFA